MLNDQLEHIAKLIDNIDINGTKLISEAVEDIKDILEDHNNQINQII